MKATILLLLICYTAAVFSIGRYYGTHCSLQIVKDARADGVCQHPSHAEIKAGQASNVVGWCWYCEICGKHVSSNDLDSAIAKELEQ